MNFVSKPDIGGTPLQTELDYRQTLANNNISAGLSDASTEWHRFGQSYKHELREILKEAARPMHTCMYCNLSKGHDIEHFYPKTPYPQHLFSYDNYLLSCAHCNTILKGSRFPLDLATGDPLLINPSKVNPWNFMAFSGTLYCFIPRTDPATRKPYLNARETIKIFKLDKDQYKLDNFKRCYMTITRMVDQFLEFPTQTNVFITDLITADTIGLLNWCILYEGANESPFLELANTYPELWQQLNQRVRETY